MISSRRSIRFPITLAVVMIVMLVALTIGWVLLATFGALGDPAWASFYWTLLTIGSTFLVMVLVGTCLYLALTIRAINLSRRQSNFIDSVTHELKSPIASLKLYLQTLNRHQVSQEQQADFHRFMLEDVERLDHLINQVLDAGRLERGTMVGEEEEVALEELLEDCAKYVCLAYRVPAPTVSLDLRPVRAYARRADLEMIFRNLIDNAVKYAGDPPAVEVSLRREEDGKAVVQVIDNGRGIPAKYRRKVFGRFVRLGLELERDRPGTGLGLYIVHTLVRKLRGRVQIRDRAAGEPGTLFEVRIPASPGPPNAAPATDADQQKIAATTDSEYQTSHR